MKYLLGKVKYICVYLFCGIVASVCSIVSCYMGNFYEYAGGASGAICGLMGILIVFAFFGKGKISDISLKDLIFLSVITILNGYASGLFPHKSLFQESSVTRQNLPVDSQKYIIYHNPH